VIGAMDWEIPVCHVDGGGYLDLLAGQGAPAKLMNRVQVGRIAPWSTVPYAARNTRRRRSS